MTKGLFIVTITPPRGEGTSYMVQALSEASAKLVALKHAGVRDPAGMTVEVRSDLAIADPEGSNAASPKWGWMVIASNPDGRVIGQQFLVALESGEQAINAARKRVDPRLVMSLGARLDPDHFDRRKMKAGDVLELGGQQLPRAKNIRR